VFATISAANFNLYSLIFYATQLDFLSEAEMMKHFDHKNIVKLLGVCTRGEPVYAVMEFMLHGMFVTCLVESGGIWAFNCFIVLQWCGFVSYWL